jgi:hypothetical protein
MHTVDGVYVPERSAASHATQAAGMLIEDGKLALAQDLFALDETEVTDSDSRLNSILADFGL